MKSYGQFCPIAQALEILAERWTLLVVRELALGSTRFTELCRGNPQMSRTMLVQRLRTLEETGIVVRDLDRIGPCYRLSDAGEELRPILEAIGHWGKRHAYRELPDDHLDPKLLMWDVQRRLRSECLPDTRKVVLFRFSDAKKGERRFWLCVQNSGVDLCLKNPGFGVDLTLDTDVRTLTEVWLGKTSFQACVKDGTIKLAGSRAIARAFPDWLLLSLFAPER